jgi:transposase
VPAVPSSIIDPLWHQFEALIPAVADEHPLGCHRPRVPDRIVFNKLIQVLVLGAAYEKIADTTCSATTIRRRRDEWINAGIFTELEQLCLRSYDKMIGLDLQDLVVDGCIVKAPCGGEAAGRSPVDRGKQGTKRSLLVDGNGIPLGCVAAGANRNDSLLLAPTLEKLSRFGFDLPERITVHLDAGYDSGKTRELLAALGCDGIISTKGEPLQAGKRWVVERTNSWHNRGFRKLHICTERRIRVIDAFIALANAVIITRRLLAEAWSRYRWDSRPTRQP